MGCGQRRRFSSHRFSSSIQRRPSGMDADRRRSKHLDDLHGDRLDERGDLLLPGFNPNGRRGQCPDAVFGRCPQGRAGCPRRSYWNSRQWTGVADVVACRLERRDSHWLCGRIHPGRWQPPDGPDQQCVASLYGHRFGKRHLVHVPSSSRERSRFGSLERGIECCLARRGPWHADGFCRHGWRRKRRAVVGRACEQRRRCDHKLHSRVHGGRRVCAYGDGRVEPVHTHRAVKRHQLLTPGCSKQLCWPRRVHGFLESRPCDDSWDSDQPDGNRRQHLGQARPKLDCPGEHRRVGHHQLHRRVHGGRRVCANGQHRHGHDIVQP